MPPPDDRQPRNPTQAQRESLAGDASSRRGDLRSACAHYQQAIHLDPENPHYHFQLGAMQWGLNLPGAPNTFQRAIELNPNFATAHAALSAWSLQHGQIAQADQSSLRAMQISPSDPSVMQSRASVLEVLGDLDQAWTLVEKLVANNIVPIPIIRLYGRMARYRDRQPQALSLIAAQLSSRSWRPIDQARLHLTAADLLDSLGRYDEAFTQAQLGNQKMAVPYDRGSHQHTFDAFIAYFTRDRMRSLAQSTNHNPAPIFIVGMPRSGTSLVEQILASHPSVHGAGELTSISQLWEKILTTLNSTDDQYPACLDHLTTQQADTLSREYLDTLQSLNPAALHIIDKMPLNFLHLGLIALLLPGSKIIDCRRDPRDTCLSCFFSMFESGNDFKYDLSTCAHFYTQYSRLMIHWKSVLDLPILEVSYEALVQNQEFQTRQMLNFLGLDWHPNCLQFHKTSRPVTTSSRQQVRHPLYTSSIGRWKNYTPHLQELNKQLQENGVEIETSLPH
ncbi:MAG TPA: sulfotransferase [Tepidisphaeraceae bacterium]|jgi:hypothetical protein|nr:sulfotransferase [Tepidisphaeraceae bacterium]